jgi:hypothetical protein
VSGYALWFDELLEFEAAHGIRSACHVLWYGSGRGSPVCVLGNFDEGGGASDHERDRERGDLRRRAV